MNIDININIDIIPILKWYDMVSYSIVHQITHAVHQFKDTQEKSTWPIILCQVSSCARPECHSSRSQGIMLYRIIASTYQVYVYLKSIVLWQCIHDMIQHGIDLTSWSMWWICAKSYRRDLNLLRYSYVSCQQIREWIAALPASPSASGRSRRGRS